MSVFSTIFSDELKLNLVDDNSFLAKFSDYSAWIIGEGQILSIPNMDFTPTVTKGLATDAAFTTSSTTETAKTFQLERYQIAPYRVPLADELYTSYDKMLGVAKQITNKMVDYIHTEVLIGVAKEVDATRVVATTGSVGVANNPFGGNSKMLTIKDLFSVAKAMDKDKVKKDGRYVLLNPEMYHELMSSADNIAYNRTDFIGQTPLESGVINKIAGINIMVRAEIPVFDGAIIQEQGVAAVAASRFNAIAWQSDEVAFALGKIDVLEEKRNVFKFADLISAETYTFAGSPRIANKRIGVYSLRQG